MARDISILKQEERGFTLIELLVAIAIVILLTGIITPSWKTSQDSLALQRSAVKVSQDVKRTSELALRAQWFSCATGRISGYGIYFSVSSPNSYIIFADCNNNQTYNAGADGVVETINLESRIAIVAASQNAFSVVFIPPDPAVFVKDQSGAQLPGAQLTLATQSNSSNVKSIGINGKGVVSIQ